MSNKFGASASEDYFGILALTSTGAGATLADCLTIQEAADDPDEKTEADAIDYKGDVAARALHGNDGFTLRTVSSVFFVKGEFKLVDLYLGQLSTATDRIIESIAIESTNGGELPKVTITGKLGAKEITPPDDFLAEFTLPGITVEPQMIAQNYGLFTAAANTALQSASLTCSVNIAQQNDGVGEPAAHGVMAGNAVLEANILAVTASPAWTIVTDIVTFVESKKPGKASGQAAWWDGSGTASLPLVRKSST